ncbi:hypothetical protein VRU48_10140 [Pedobacter sp. KR3-3]|uniref:Lipoprotein n=1 Tax=Pedobacter albus TaxID=3113905 RepID=A0ABU7I7W0_9SPHI|nr:hypothetical protein [Pedobacter sp. KR3-3]MEE1945469.1 hypothetical protein [Pedobacter sp. KR3-3]
MKKTVLLSIVFLVSILIACSGSDTYRGEWKATDTKGEKSKITFEAKSFVFTDSTGKSKKFNYTQNSIKTENGVETYGIVLEDGRKYELNFPKANDESQGIIKDENGKLIYAIGRKDYISYEDVFGLK